MAHDPSPISARRLADSYGEHYFKHYANAADVPYSRDEPIWTVFFGEIARRISAQLQPQTVLDAGCAIGLLVEAFRDGGVEAWGVDLSSYAINQVRPDIRSFCQVASLTQELDRDYDLITCVEVLEHLPAEQVDRAVANFARHTGLVLLSSTPDDYPEPTHLNVQPTDFWVGLFATHGLYRDLDFDAGFVSPHAMLFRRQLGVPVATLRAYERRLWQAGVENRVLRTSYQAAVDASSDHQLQLEHHEVERHLLAMEVDHWQWQLARARAQLEQRPTTDAPALPTAPAQARGLAQGNGSAALPSSARRVLFVSDGSDAPRRYRCEHHAEALRLLGWSAEVITYDDVYGSLTSVVDGFDAYILQRLPLRPHVEWLIERAHDSGRPVMYEVDDLIFDPASAAHWAPFASMNEAQRHQTRHGFWRNGQTLRKCDAVIVPTEALAESARRIQGCVHVVPNAVGQDMLRQADRARAQRRASAAQQPITLGYFSGTPTHDRDFGQAADAVRWALDKFPHTRLLVVGPLTLPDSLAKVGERVRHLDLQPWRALPAQLAEADVNLAPLEPHNPFTDAKSCVKYLEAALLEVPTIASPRPDFARVIEHGQNGLLADSADQWQAALSDMIEMDSLRAAVGARARADVLARHTTATRASQLAGVIEAQIQRARLLA